MKIIGKLVNVHTRSIFDAEIFIENGIITDITQSDKTYERFILPGLIDAHVHIESSMVTPAAFAAALAVFAFAPLALVAFVMFTVALAVPAAAVPRILGLIAAVACYGVDVGDVT